MQIVLCHSPVDRYGGCQQNYNESFIARSSVTFSNNACYNSDYRVQRTNYGVQVITHMLSVFQIQQSFVSMPCIYISQT